MTQLGYGTLSPFRDDSKAIKKNLKILDLACQFHDNFLTINLEGGRGSEARDKIVDALERFVKHMSLTIGQLFSYRILFIESDDKVLYPLSRRFKMSVTTYDLDRLSSNIEEAEKMAGLNDPILDRALQYYEHSMFLYEKRELIADFLSSHFRFMISEIFLNMWKAASTVVGDPTVDKDYSRYRKLGISQEFFDTKIEVARHLRNDYDVAHYRLDLDRLDDIERNYGLVKEVAERILREYRIYLSEGKTSFAEQPSLKAGVES